jgi:hypothetical protein
VQCRHRPLRPKDSCGALTNYSIAPDKFVDSIAVADSLSTAIPANRAIVAAALQFST